MYNDDFNKNSLKKSGVYWNQLSIMEKFCIFGNQKTLGSNACLCELG